MYKQELKITKMEWFEAQERKSSRLAEYYFWTFCVALPIVFTLIRLFWR